MFKIKNLEQIGLSSEELARSIGNFSYYQTSQFIENLADVMKSKADVNKINGNLDVATKLYEIANKLYETSYDINVAWKLMK